MSVVARNRTRIVLPRSGADSFWKLIQDHFAEENPRDWKDLAILALRENAGWPLEQIGMVFGHPKGHVTRILRNIKQKLRERFEAEPSMDPEESETT